MPLSASGENGLPFVGRRRELDRLHECLRRARGGERQVVFITGEAGIGKTTLSEAFLRSPAIADPDVHVLHGQCIRQHGEREPYMPVLEALERVLGSPVGRSLIPLFRRVAPCWFVQIPWLLSESEAGGFQGAMMSAPPERMLREIGAFLESMASSSTVVLVLEDLHWGDNATADFLSFVGERRDVARLLIIGTYRSAEASAHEHPIRQVKQTLQSHRHCVELALDYLSTADIREYLQRRFGEPVQDLARPIHERTDGNPLFVVAIVEELIRRGRLTDTDGGWVMRPGAGPTDLTVPDDLLEMITAQFLSLTADERAVLEAASVAGVSFAPWTVAQALGRDVEEVEAIAQRLVRSRLFLTVSRAEDSGPAKRYDFAHALHHQVIYEQVTGRRRQRLHQAIGEALESTHRERLAEIAPQLSAHFERSGDHRRAATYLVLCAARAQQRLAPHEAVACAERGLALVQQMPETPDRQRLELDLRLVLGVPLHVTRGYTAPEVRDNYERARGLCEAVGQAPQLFEIVHAVWYAQMIRSDIAGAEQSIGELARLAGREQAEEFRLRAELARGRTDFWKGDFGAAARVYAAFLENSTKHPIGIRAETYGIDPVIAAYVQGGLALWFLGYPDRARASAARGVARAETSRQPFGLASALYHSTLLELLCRNAQAATPLAARASKVTTDHDVALFVFWSRFYRGAVLAEGGDLDGGLSEMLPSLAENRAVFGSLGCGIMFGLLAAAYRRGERWDEGLRRVDEGIELAETTRERIYIAELWRLKGELLRGKASRSKGRRSAGGGRMADAAEQSVRRALEIARAQEARSLELRAAMSLVRLAMGRDAKSEARELLRSIHGSFTEGFDTRDLVDATMLLDHDD